jgi:hypothetical protein
VRVVNCSVSTHADGIAVRAGRDDQPNRAPCEDVQIANCHLKSRSYALSIGSEIAGGVRNIAVSNCVVSDSAVGVMLKTMRGRGGVIEEVRVSDVVMDRVRTALELTSHWKDKGDRWAGRAADAGTPTLRNLAFCGLTLNGVEQVALVEGLPERFIKGVKIARVSAAHARAGISASKVCDLRVEGLTLDGLEQHAVDARSVQRLEVHRLACSRGEAKAPLVRLQNVRGAFVHGCDVGVAGAAFVQLEGEDNQGVELAANNVPGEPDADIGIRARSR